MDVNGDFSKRVVLHSDSIEWEDSPMAGVTRKRLDRVDNKADRVTTIVKYAAGSSFSPHVHTGGEEFIVLSGVFEDDYGDWPAGSYIRNPPTSKHKPGSKEGCIIFVKLSQFQANDRTFVHTHIDKLGAVMDANRPGVIVSPLYKDDHEEVSIEYWDANSTIKLDAKDGAEIFVLKGGFTEQGSAGEKLHKDSWLRVPVDTLVNATTDSTGAKVWVKTGHLRDVVNG